VRFPDGSRRKVARVEKANAQADLSVLLAQRAAAEKPVPRRQRLASFNELINEWLLAGCPSSMLIARAEKEAEEMTGAGGAGPRASASFTRTSRARPRRLPGRPS
jgi:hypothetical protein